MTDSNELFSADDCPGWDAIDAAMVAVYGNQEPLHFGTLIKYVLGGPDPLDGVSVFKSEMGRPHWHYVTYGFSELYRKESDDPSNSGYGFELTMRLPRQGDEPPMWVIEFFQNIARYVFSSGNSFEVGHHMDANGPLCLEAETDITAIVFAEDMELPGRETPHGYLRFVQVVGITVDELAAIRSWQSKPFLQLLARDNPFLLTDLSRHSIMKQADMVAAVKDGARRDGSSTGMLFVESLDWKIAGIFKKKCTITLGSLIVPELKELISARLQHDKPLKLISHSSQVLLAPAATSNWTNDDGCLLLSISLDDISRFVSNINEKEGSYEVLPGLTLAVAKQEVSAC